MSGIADKFQALRDRWEARLRKRDPEAIQTIRAVLRAWLHRRQHVVEESVEALWESHEDYFTGMYVAFYDRVHTRRRNQGDSYGDAHDAAHAAAVSRVRRAFFAALRREWVQREDDRLRWMWAGGYADLLEEVDGRGLELLLNTVLALVNAVSSRVPQLAVATDALEGLADARIESLLDAAIDGEPTPAPTRAEAVHAQPIRPRQPRPDAVLSEGGTTLHDLAAADDLDDPTDDDDPEVDVDDSDTVITADPATEAPSRAPFPEVAPVSKLRQRMERALHQHTPAGKTAARLKSIVTRDRAAAPAAGDLDLSGLAVPTPGGES